jgi:phospholipid/cholesterol/gamma-HCH transport system ATP-binding protein
MIEFKNIHKKFDEKEVLNGISFSVKKREIYFIIGKSGTGKSVLLKNITGLLKPDKGNIFIDKTNVTNFSEEEFLQLRKRCGLILQHPALFDSFNIFDNIAFALTRNFTLSESELKESVSNALSLVGFKKDIFLKMPSDISFGMQKRVSLARTIALRPDILLFDEPTTGLDPVTTGEISDLIYHLSKKLHTTSIVVSHDMKTALSIADKIMVLDKGKIIEESTPKKLLKSKNILVQNFLHEVSL